MEETSLKLSSELKFDEIRRAKVATFGTNGAHIPFTKTHLGKEVLILAAW